jgi:hypothetical protein
MRLLICRLSVLMHALEVIRALLVAMAALTLILISHLNAPL